MEPANIDWKSLESVFMVDHVYENINAPQWFDFLSPPHHSYHDDSWFCRSDCKHPKTADDFLKFTPTSKLLRSLSVSKLTGLGDWAPRRETNLKWRGGVGQSSSYTSENQNPNYSTPHHQLKASKAAIKSSAEKVYKEEEEDERYSEILLKSEEKPRLKNTQELFGGTDILGKITQLCNELKKMASIPPKQKEKEKEDVHHHPPEAECHRSPNSTIKPKPLASALTSTSGVQKEDTLVLGELVVDKKMTDRYKERKPLLDVTPKHKTRKIKRGHEAENIPISLELKDMKHRGEEESLLPIRTNPPTPQGFSATRAPTKGTKSRLMEREILEEGEQKKTIREEVVEKSPTTKASLVAGKEGRAALDVFWFLKPCTL